MNSHFGTAKVVFDFDGVINSYTSGYVADDIIPDKPVPGIKELFVRLRRAGYRVIVVSTRCASCEGLKAIKDWLAEYDIVVDDVTDTKPPARCYVDDRAVRFDGDAASMFDVIDNFEPWWKR